ncbi:hypothetical protein [Streptomyces sp. NPDC012888]|uniref:hypothetical protein n=1 Tax=Streptomyces sp. NPDC012888 TaxID=3364855 RepID=UPI0036C09295
MANLVYKRVSTDQQSTARQDLVLDEAGIENPVVFEEDPGTSSRLHPLQRPSSANCSPTRGRATMTARSPPWTSPPATPAPASCCPP